VKIWAWEPLTKKSRKGRPRSCIKKERENTDHLRKANASYKKIRTPEIQRKISRKWCDLHKIPWHNTVDFHSKKSLVVEAKAFELDVDFDSNSEPERGRKIIDAEPSATIATTKL
jgi:hypothetical protein